MARSSYVLIVDTKNLNDKAESYCNVAEAWLDDNEGNDLSIAVRPAKEGESPGVYFVERFGIKNLGGDVPKHVAKLIKKALEHAESSIN